MQKISDIVTSTFRIDTKDGRPVACSSGDGTVVWSDIFGLGWRLGISYNPNEWFALVHFHLDHNLSHSEQDQAIASVSLKDSADKDATAHRQSVTTITHFGHGPPTLLGSWSTYDLSWHPYVSLTLTTKTRIPHPVSDPLSSAALAIRQSMETGDFVNTKFYAFSAKRPNGSAGKPRVVYVNSNSIGLALPKSTSGAKQADGDGLPPKFLLNMSSDHQVTSDAVLNEYEYELDSDLDEDDDDEDDDDKDQLQPNSVSLPGGFQTPSSSQPSSSTKPSAHGTPEDVELPAEPPAYSISTCRTILVKGVAYKTWASYIFFRYTGQVFFLPLKSGQPSSGTRNDPNPPPSCSPKSMYRLAALLEDERLKELAFRAITEGLSKDNIIEEAFSCFAAQHPAVREYEVEKVSELRKSPEVTSALKLQLKAVSLGEKPWAQDVLIAIMDKLNSPGKLP